MTLKALCIDMPQLCLPLFKVEYELLATRLSNYVVELLDNVRGNDELHVILNAVAADSVDLDCHGKLARLNLAIHYEEKKVCITEQN